MHLFRLCVLKVSLDGVACAMPDKSDRGAMWQCGIFIISKKRRMKIFSTR